MIKSSDPLLTWGRLRRKISANASCIIIYSINATNYGGSIYGYNVYRHTSRTVYDNDTWLHYYTFKYVFDNKRWILYRSQLFHASRCFLIVGHHRPLLEMTLSKTQPSCCVLIIKGQTDVIVVLTALQRMTRQPKIIPCASATFHHTNQNGPYDVRGPQQG